MYSTNCPVFHERYALLSRSSYKMTTNKDGLPPGGIKRRHTDNGSNHRCLTALVRKCRFLSGCFTREVKLCLSKACQYYNRWTCFSHWQQEPNIHERETWIECCVVPVKARTMPGWVTGSSGEMCLLITQSSDYISLTAVSQMFALILHERCGAPSILLLTWDYTNICARLFGPWVIIQHW